MAGLLITGTIGAGLSLYGMYRSNAMWSRTSAKKDELINNAQSLTSVLQNSADVYEKSFGGKSFLVHHMSPIPCGLLSISEKTVDHHTSILYDAQTGLIVAKNEQMPRWSSTGMYRYGMNMGLDTSRLVIPSDDSKILHDGKDVQHSSGNTSWLRQYMSTFGFTNILLPERTKYAVAHYPFYVKPVFMYGMRGAGGEFRAELVGNNSKIVADKVFEQENTNASVCMVGSVTCLILSVLAACAGASEIKM